MDDNLGIPLNVILDPGLPCANLCSHDRWVGIIFRKKILLYVISLSVLRHVEIFHHVL
jgi:hypothetical protein